MIGIARKIDRGHEAMWKSRGVQCVAVALVIVSMAMGGGCSLFNEAPTITSFAPNATRVAPGESCTIVCVADDPNGDALSYTWASTAGTISGEGNAISWMAPAAEGSYAINVTVSDGKGGTATASCTVIVKPTPGSIDVKSKPSGAAVYLDGEDTGRVTPCVITNVEAGSHTIRLVLPHYKYGEGILVVNSSETSYINWALAYAKERTVIIQPDAARGKDASVDIRYEDQNYADLYRLGAGKGRTDTWRAYLEFNLSSIPENAMLTVASLGLYYYGTPDGEIAAPIGAYRVEEAWNETGVTWNSQPDCASTPEYTRIVPGPLTSSVLYWDISDLVRSWWDGSVQNYGVMLRDTDESTTESWKVFYSSEWENDFQRPKLTVTYYDPTP